jgi:hypothetical protein
LAIDLDVVPAVVGSSANDVLEFEFTGWVFEFFLVKVLLDLCELQTLVPDLVDETHELGIVGNLAEGVGNVWQEVVEVKLPILILVLHPVLKNALIVVPSDEHFSVFKNVDGLDH